MSPAARRRRWLNSLFWKVSAIFLVVLLAFAAFSMWIDLGASRNYAMEVTQRLNHDLAEHTANEVRPFLNGEVADDRIGTLMHSMMAVNPGIEVYVLDTTGRILKYVALEGAVKLDRVSLGPIHDFLAQHAGDAPIVGDDPRTPGERKIFSAAPVVERGHVAGYVYIILAGQEYVGAARTLGNSYFLRVAMRSVLIALILTLIAGVVAIYFITHNLDRIVSGFRRFHEGHLDTRIALGGGGELSEVAHTFNDMAATIERTIDELKDLDRLRKELIGNVSHDLRTPIAVIHGYAETLLMKQGTITPEEARSHLIVIAKSADRLRTLVDDLFTLSKLESSQVKLDLEPLLLGELVHDVVNKLRLLADEKLVNMKVIIARDLPFVNVDVKKIDRVVQNLVHNAIKFCRPGDHITIEMGSPRAGQVEVRIIDSGVGIPSEDLPYIFDRYFRGQRAGAQDGSGLGLAIVKRILQLHGSDVEVKSTPGQGSTFRFVLAASASIRP